MSNPPNNGRNRPLRGGPDKFQPKVLLIWAAIILGMISLFMLTEPAKKQIQELSISQVVDAAKNDYVASGTIRPNVGSGHSDWSEIQGEFKAGSPRPMALNRLSPHADA
jgi:cell division protease FtsH